MTELPGTTEVPTTTERSRADGTPVTAEIMSDVRIPMRDGVSLLADIYLPAKAADTPIPALVTRTAYNKTGFLSTISDPAALAAEGYAVIVQDKRGRFASEGEWTLLRDDSSGVHQDGFDTVEWAAAQSWCDGRVGVFGLSYLGHATMGAAIAAPPHLVAAVSIQPSTDEFTDRTFIDGVLNLQNIVDWATSDMIAPSMIAKLPEDKRAAVRADLDLYRSRGTDQYAELPLSTWPFYRLFPMLWHDPLTHREDEDFFAESRVGQAEVNRIRVPIVHVGGWYDFFPRNTVRQFELAAAHSQASQGQRLVMGPWSHGALGSDTVAGISFPDAAINSNRLIAEWVDVNLRDPRAAEALPQALLYVLGVDRWREEPIWPIPGTEVQSLHLTADGRLESTEPAIGERSFRYDPMDPYAAPSVVAGPVDATGHHLTDNVLVYDSPAATEEWEITGWPRVTLQAATSGTDADWLAELSVLRPDGTSRLIDEGVTRARYREGRNRPLAVTPGIPTEYTIELRPISIILMPGEQLRLVITGGKFPTFERNPNAFVDVNEAVASDFTVATNTIFSGGLTGSRLEIPTVPAAARGTWVENPWPSATRSPGQPHPTPEAHS